LQQILILSIKILPIIQEGDRYTISAIFHLLEKRGEIKEGDLERALYQMFTYPVPIVERSQLYKSPVNRGAFDLSYEAYRRIPILTLPYGKTPNSRYHKLKEVIVSFGNQSH